MAIFAGLNVSAKTTHVCVVDVEGVVMRRDVVASNPDVIAFAAEAQLSQSGGTEDLNFRFRPNLSPQGAKFMNDNGNIRAI